MNPFRGLTIRYVGALLTVALLAISGQYLIQFSLVRQDADMKRIKLANSQRLVAHLLKETALKIQLTATRREIAEALGVLRSKSAELAEGQHELRSLGPPRIESAAGKLSAMETPFQTMAKASRRILMALDRSRNLSYRKYEIQNEAQKIVGAEGVYRGLLEQLIRTLEAQATNRISRLKRIESILLVLTLLVLLMEGLLIFKPAVEKLSRAMRELEESRAGLREARDAAEKALAVRSAFLSKMSHEIRNPLNAILGMASVLSQMNARSGGVNQQRYLDIIQRAGGTLLGLLNDLLNFSQLEAGRLLVRKEKIDLVSLLDRVVDLVASSAHEKNLELIVDVPSDFAVYHLDTDPIRLQQVLINLLSNAIKFTDVGEVVLSVHQSGGRCLFCVADTGIGIASEKQDTIFDGFVQVAPSSQKIYGGAGLGLSIAKQLVTLLGGELRVESQIRQGSRFFFSLPAGDLVVARRRFEGFEVTLIVQNDRLRETIARWLADWGAEVEPRRNWEEALPCLVGRSAPLVIIDGLGAPDRVAAVDKLKKEYHGAVLFLLTLHQVNESVLRFGETVGYLFKPIKTSELHHSISEKLFTSHVPSTPLVTGLPGAAPLGLKILVVDDSGDNRLIVEAFLESESCDIEFAENGKIGLGLFERKRFDVILMDIQMPEMDGIEATRRMRATELSRGQSPTPILALTAYDHPGELMAIRMAGASASLVKPITRESLVRALRDARGEQSQSNLRKDYLRRRVAELELVKRAQTDRKYETLEVVGHRLKGNAKSFGFDELGVIGKSLEEAAQKKDADSIDTVVCTLEKYIDIRTREIL